MRKILEVVKLVGITGFVFIYILSCFTAHLAPLAFSFSALLGLMFPYFFGAMSILVLLSLIFQRRLGWILLIFWSVGLYNFFHVFALRPGSFRMAKDSSTIRVLTWNVEGMNPNIKNQTATSYDYLKTIAAYDPDIVCLQEYSNDFGVPPNAKTSEKLLDSMGYTGTNIVFDSIVWGDKPMLINTGVAIFCKKYVLIEKSKSIFHAGTRVQGYATADIVIKGHPVRINSGRLASYGLYYDTANANKSTLEITMDRKRAVQRSLRVTEQIHQDQISIIRKDLDYSPLPLIYCGDMNSVAASYNYFALKGSDLQDGFLNGGWGIGATFYNIVPTLRIDLCFSTSKAFKVIQSAVIHRKVSDHYPLVTDLQWRPEYFNNKTIP